MCDHHKPSLAIARTILNADRVRATVDQPLPVLASGLICLSFVRHLQACILPYSSAGNKVKVQSLRYLANRIENAALI